MTTGDRVSTGLARLDAMLDGGLLPGTLTVVYGATGIGKTHLGLAFAAQGRQADGRRGLVVDMNARGDSQQHVPYAARLHGWPLTRWTHTVMPMADPYPPPDELEAHYLDVFSWVGRRSDYELATPEGREFDWGWKAAYARALYTARPFFYFHFAHGAHRVAIDGIEPCQPDDAIQLYLVDELYRKVIHRDAETLGMEICLPVWRHRAFIDAHRYDHGAITTLLLFTTEETRLEDLVARKMLAGDPGAVANTVLLMGREKVGTRVGRFVGVAKHRGSAMTDEIVEYRIDERGLTFE
ncbi:MAG TPA: ATPase domain-containing protein [Methylomirabilota bacterium]|nr:ATPase domain-containing protein [Methylomirabilota bacterium]